MALTEDEIARRAGTTPARVRQLAELGIVGRGDDPEAPFRSGDSLRVQLVDELESFGIERSRVAEALAEGALSLSYLDRFPDPPRRTTQTFAELCDELGIRFELLARIFAGFGLRRPQPGEPVREDDREIVTGLPILFESGLGEGEVLRAARVWGEGPRRVAQHQVHSFHELIEEPFRRQGLSDDQALDAALTEVGVRLIPYCERLVGWLYRRHFESYATEHRVGHIETALESAGLYRRTVAGPQTCAFADLSGYTRRTEELGDAAAEQMALGLADLIQDVANRHDGLVVKMLGDGVHFHFDEPESAVQASLELVERAEPEGLPPAHVGVNAGPMTYIDGDYYGFTVILAARIAAHAGAGEVLVGEAVVEQAPAGVRFQRLETPSLKGIAREVRVYRALREVA